MLGDERRENLRFALNLARRRVIRVTGRQNLGKRAIELGVGGPVRPRPYRLRERLENLVRAEVVPVTRLWGPAAMYRSLGAGVSAEPPGSSFSAFRLDSGAVIAARKHARDRRTGSRRTATPRTSTGRSLERMERPHPTSRDRQKAPVTAPMAAREYPERHRTNGIDAWPPAR